MTDETELLKREAKNLSKEKVELETTVDDLKRTLKLTEKESQVTFCFIILNIYVYITKPNTRLVESVESPFTFHE